VDLYGRPFVIVGCDGATRRWLGDQGSPPVEDGEWPEGPHDTAKKVGGCGAMRDGGALCLFVQCISRRGSCEAFGITSALSNTNST